MDGLGAQRCAYGGVLSASGGGCEDVDDDDDKDEGGLEKEL